MKRKKVLILGKLPPPYMGPAIATQIILNSSLKEHFHLLHLDTRINKSIAAFGKWSLGKIFRNISLYRKMSKMISEEKPDLVLIPISQTTTGFVKDSVFIRIAHKHGCKVVLQLRGSNFKNWMQTASARVQRMVRRHFQRAQGMIVLGNNLKHLFEDYFPQEKLFVVPNGADYSFPARQEHEEVRILYFSNFLISKGIEDVIRAIGTIETNINYSVDLVGAWSNKADQEKCSDLLRMIKVPVRLHLPKGGSEKLQFFANADIFVFPPREPEGHPWAIVEAMAAGLPVISTNQGAIIESVINCKNGFIVNPGTPAEIAQKLKLLLENSTLRKQMGNESRNLYLLNFTEAKMVERLKNIFDSLITP